MPAPDTSSRGRDLALRLDDGRRDVAQAPVAGARDLFVLRGITPKCVFTAPLENVRAEATRHLVEALKVFCYGDTIVYESVVGADRRLVTLSRGGSVEAPAASTLANLLVCEHAEPGRDPVQFPPPLPLVSLLLNSVPLRETLPQIRVYATRPVFDRDFNLLTVGYHAGHGIMVHGPEVDPLVDTGPIPDGPVLDRLPPRLRALLANFCFRSPADVVAAVAAMLTGLLVNHFVAVGKPIVLIDGNQPGLGKTLLARVVGILLDGADPRAIHYTPEDEELAKRVCATARDLTRSVILVDNAKLRAGGVVSSPVLESNSMAPEISLRILGKSANFNRPNDMTWFLTMNDTKTSPDLVSRGMPIRLSFDGDPRNREFAGQEPITFAAAHRAEILGELAGMVIRWNIAGRPEGGRRHRCDGWSRVIGGICESAGLPEFLGNIEEAAASFNSALDDLAALAEAAASDGGDVVVPAQADRQGSPPGKVAKKDTPGLSAGGWEPFFRKAGVQIAELDAARSSQGKATVIGNFLATNIGREVPIQVAGNQGRAVLEVGDAGRRQRRYAFRLAWDEALPVPRADRGDHREVMRMDDSRRIRPIPKAPAG